MLKSTLLEQQYEKAGKGNLRVLIAGAGIAGITAAQMLRKGGLHPVLIERNAGNSHPGYMLALMPMVDAVLDDLEVRDVYREQSVALGRYGFHSHKGKLIREDSMAAILNRYGDYRGIGRGELLDVLTHEGCDLSFDTTITAMEELKDHTLVTLKNGENTCSLAFDLIIVADGLHSSTRNFILNADKIDYVDTHWGGWVVWAPEDDNTDLGEELWGSGFFFGVYPVKGHLGVFLGGNHKDTEMGPAAFVSKVRKKLDTISPRLESCLKAVTEASDPYYWPLKDCRSLQWASGHTVLLGDAAAGFLPTAGIGAGMAMESAWVLTRMLRYATKDTANLLLKAYETAQRPRVEAAQGTSRGLAGIMFRQSEALAYLRDWLMHLVSVETAIRPIQRLLASKPDPDQLAKTALNERYLY